GTKTVHRCRPIGDLIRKWKVLKEEQQCALIQRFEPQEVKKAMFQIYSTKSPGPEGYDSGFYKAAWSLVGEDVTNVVQEFFQNSKILRQINSTSITLNPKIENVSPRSFMKIDLRKAYDMVRWEFIEEVLVMEYLSRTLQTMSELLDFRLHPMYKKLQLTHLFFVDDLMIFCKGNVSSVSRLMEALAHFNVATGLEANLDKSSIFLAGVDEDTRRKILTITQFSVGPSTSTFSTPSPQVRGVQHASPVALLMHASLETDMFPRLNYAGLIMTSDEHDLFL
ncbi:hypothetical protein KY284_010587, partial [Solanum tuberosum]